MFGRDRGGLSPAHCTLLGARRIDRRIDRSKRYRGGGRLSTTSVPRRRDRDACPLVLRTLHDPTGSHEVARVQGGESVRVGRREAEASETPLAAVAHLFLELLDERPTPSH